MDEPAFTCPPGDVLVKLPAEQRAELLRTFIDSAIDAIIAHEPDGTVLFYSQGACELLGYRQEEMAELGPFGWVSAESMRGAPNRLETILHEGLLTFESAIRRKDGKTIPTEVTARRVDTQLGPLIIAVIRDISERQAAQAKLVYLAYHDGLTGLANRSSFDDRVKLVLADARRHGDQVALAYIDLDRFKPINDRFGHDAGDQVLIEVGRRLVECVREQDLVARLGGDEFVVIFPRLEGPEELGTIAERLLRRVRDPIDACGVDCEIDASIGFAIYEPEVDDARSLLVKADVAMYSAKRDPGHSWLLYDESMGEIGHI